MAASGSEADATLSTAPSQWRWLEWATRSGRSWLVLSWLGLLILLGLVAAFGTDAGISFDEGLHRRYGELVLAWFHTGFEDQGALTFHNLYLYGGLFDALAQLIASASPLDVFDTRHVLSALLAVLGIFASWKMAARIGGARAGFCAGLFLALTPVWVGHGLFNPKDIPFGTATAFVGVAALRIALGPAAIRVRDMCLSGLAVGIALAIRPGGIFVLAFPCLAAGLRTGLEIWRRWRARQPLSFGGSLASVAACLVLSVCIAWPLMVIAWPWAQLEPFRRPLEAMAEARNFVFDGAMLWNGETILPQHTPLRYLPVWFAITLPETYLLAVLAGVALLVRIAMRRSWHGEVAVGVITLLSMFALPLAAVFLTRPPIYDAYRHFLFLLPPLAAVAGCVLSEILAAAWLRPLVRAAVAGGAGALALFVVVDMVELHPYEYTYFNRGSGGLRAQYQRFETDYWGVSYKEGLQWVVNELPRVDPSRRTRVTACEFHGNARLNYYRRLWPGAADKIEVVLHYEQADVLLAVRRYNCHDVGGEILHLVTRQGAPLLYVRRTVH